LIVAIYPERQRPAARIVDETEVEEGERVEVLEGPVLRESREERVFWREHLGEADHRIATSLHWMWILVEGGMETLERRRGMSMHRPSS
jgi:hypothetical protein